ncbi:hypothetical protein [Nocardioides korecus]
MDDLNAWRVHTHALNLVRQVDETIDQLEMRGVSVEVFRDSLPYWYAGVGFATTPWDTVENRARPAIEDTHLNMLRAFASVVAGREALSIGEDEVQSLRDTLEDAARTIAEDDALPLEAKAYMLGLVKRAIFLLDHLDKYGPEAVRDVALQLGGALFTRAEAEAEGSDAQEKFRGLGGKLANAVMTSSISEIVKQIGPHVSKAIEQGNL